MRPFKCTVTILNTIDHLGKFDGKADEGIFVGYSLNSKAFRVFNSRTRIVEENLHIRFSESTPNVVGTKASYNAGQAKKETEPVKYYILLPLWTVDLPFSQDPKSSHDDGSKPSVIMERSSTINAASTNEDNELPFDPNMPTLENVSILKFSSDDKDDGPLADMNNLDTTIKFWSTAKAKTINGEAQIHARVYRKEIVITKLSVRRDLRLAGEEGIDCLPNSTIFEQLALMGCVMGLVGIAKPSPNLDWFCITIVGNK
nr:retrovirus-related Pol polyprotein from transposon TNT 1-94 [Tanacetum cinerariifolium]